METVIQQTDTHEKVSRSNSIYQHIITENHYCEHKAVDTTHEHLLVTISKSTKLLLTSGIPAVKPYLSIVRKEVQWMNFNSDCSYT